MIRSYWLKIKNFLFIHPENNLKKQGIRSVSWSIIGKGTSYSLRLFSNILLTYILAPSSFGLMATCLVIIAMIQLFSDIGIKAAIIQHTDGDKQDFLNTAWTIALIRGFILFLLCLLISYPFSVFYEQPILLYMLLVISLSIPISSLENPGIYLNIKNLRTEIQVIYEFGSEILSIFLTVIIAYLLQNVWALVIGSLITPIFRVFFSYKLSSFRPHIFISPNYSKELLRFGKFIMVNTLVTWAALNLDTLFIGKWIGMTELGNYNIGKNLAISLEMFLVGIIGQSFFPIISSVQTDLPRVEKIYRRSSSLALTLIIPILFCMMFFSEEIVKILYRKEFLPAVTPMFWISCRGIFRVISMFQGSTLIGIGRAELETYSMSIGLLTLLSLFGLYYSKIIDTEMLLFLSRFGVNVKSVLFMEGGIVFLVGLISAFVEMIVLIFIVKCSFRSIVRPWLHSLIVLSILTLVASFSYNFMIGYNISYLVYIPSIGMISFLISIAFYFILEGKNPMKDMGGSNQ